MVKQVKKNIYIITLIIIIIDQLIKKLVISKIAYLEVVKIILRSLGKDENLISYVKDRLGHDKRYAIDPSKMVKLGWRPKYNFESGIIDTINWNVNNQEWINHVKIGRASCRERV